MPEVVEAKTYLLLDAQRSRLMALRFVVYGCKGYPGVRSRDKSALHAQLVCER